MSLAEVIAKVHAFNCRLVEITGGEPLAQTEAFVLIERLCDAGFEVLVETGGYVSTEKVDQRASLILDVKCPGSGEEGRNYWPNLDRLRRQKDELKFVIADYTDWEYAESLIRGHKLEERCKALLISPAWGKVDLKDLAGWIVKSGLNVRMQLQMHKYIWGPDVQGV